VPRPPRTRTALLELVRNGSRHDWSIEELRAGLGDRGLSADFSTVFRATEALVEKGELRRVELGTSEARFEAAGEHHEHVRCERCGAVEAIDACAVADALPSVRRATGFELTGHDLVFHGLCPACQERG
jgi:Fe2+ or Zn2+ uptake regulation protein